LTKVQVTAREGITRDCERIGFDWVQDTPYDFASASEFNCTRLRGSATSPLFW